MLFVVWVVIIAVLSIIPHANGNGGLSFKLTESGMVVHFVAYFLGSALLYWAFIKGPQITPVPSPGATGRAQITPVPSPGATGQARIRRKGTESGIRKEELGIRNLEFAPMKYARPSRLKAEPMAGRLRCD